MGYEALAYSKPFGTKGVYENLKARYGYAITFPDVSEDEYLDYVFGPFFLASYMMDDIVEKYRDTLPDGISLDNAEAFAAKYKVFKSFEDSILRNESLLGKILDGRIDGNYEGAICDLRDFLGLPLIMSRWNCNKQVYKLDPDFARALISTENLKVPREAVEYLPVGTFYVDVSGCKWFYPVLGFWLNVSCGENSCNISIFVYVHIGKPEENMVFSQYNAMTYNDEGMLKLSREKQIRAQNMSRNVGTFNFSGDTTEFFIPFEEIFVLSLQLMNYLTCQEPDVSISKLTSRQMSRAKRLNKDYDGVIENEVGVRYGSAIRSQLKDAGKECIEYVSGSEKGTHKSPVAHFRCAHWQHYWHNTENGRERFLKWKKPVFVGGSVPKDIVIHKVE